MVRLCQNVKESYIKMW